MSAGLHRWHVYYCYAADGALLYIGQTSRPVTERLNLHGHYSTCSPWFYYCTNVEISTPLTSANEARSLERSEIHRLGPVFNRQYNEDPQPWMPPAKCRRYGTLPEITATRRAPALAAHP